MADSPSTVLGLTITFLLVRRGEAADWYVRFTGGGDFSELARTTFTNEAMLPEGAKDTELRRDGRQLWVVPSRRPTW